MPTPAAQVDVEGRSVRVSSPDRVIFPPTDATPGVTKLEVVQYYADVADGLMRALHERPTAMERWPSGVLPGMTLATGRPGEKADAFYQKRLPRGAPSYVETCEVTFPSGRTAQEMCPDHAAVACWAAQMGTITFHPWPSRRGAVDQPDELRIDLDPQPGTDFADARRVALLARDVLDELGLTGWAKTSGNRGIHVFVRIQPQWTFTEARHAAIALGRELEKRDDGVTTAWWKEERGARIFVDYNQMTRDRTIASAYSLRPLPGAPVSMPLTWEQLAQVEDPGEFTLHTVPAILAEQGDAWAGIDTAAGSLQPLLDRWDEHPVELNYPPDHPKMPGEPPRVQPSKKVAAHWDEHGNRVED